MHDEREGGMQSARTGGAPSGGRRRDSSGGERELTRLVLVCSRHDKWGGGWSQASTRKTEHSTGGCVPSSFLLPPPLARLPFPLISRKSAN
jgi:hypothetical protein